MFNKITRTLLKDKDIILGFLLLAGSCVLFVLLWQKQKAQGYEIRQLQEKRQVVSKIPYYSRLLELEQEKKKVIAESPHFTLNGILFDNARNKSGAVIDGQAYYLNDRIGNFVVTRINNDSVVLRNPDTGIRYTLSLEKIP